MSTTAFPRPSTRTAATPVVIADIAAPPKRVVDAATVEARDVPRRSLARMSVSTAAAHRIPAHGDVNGSCGEHAAAGDPARRLSTALWACDGRSPSAGRQCSDQAAEADPLLFEPDRGAKHVLHEVSVEADLLRSQARQCTGDLAGLGRPLRAMVKQGLAVHEKGLDLGQVGAQLTQDRE